MRSRRFLAVALLLGGICSPSVRGQNAPSGSELSPFGVSASEQSRRVFSEWAPQMEKIDVKVARCFPGHPSIEPAEGTWNWTDVDRLLNDAARTKIEISGIFLYTPEWIRPKGDYFPTNNLPAYATFVSKTVGHSRGKVKYWEVWNEPPNGTRDGTPADYARTVVTAFDAAKAADPNCRIGLTAQSNHVNWLEQTIKAGAKGHYDYIALHPYEILGAVDEAGAEAVYMSIVPTVRKMLTAQDPAKVDVPIWFTEIGFDAGKGSDRQGQSLVKAYTMGIAQGVACINWFEGRDGDSGPMGLLEVTGKPRPSYTAMSQMIRHLGHHPTYIGWVLINGRNYGFVFRGANGTVLSTWSPKGRRDRLDFGQAVWIVNPTIGISYRTDNYELTDDPILVLGVPASLVAQAQANKTRPFPWGGDYTNSKSVSITMGETNAEKGLHTHSGAAVAADVAAYGGSARSGSIPGGNVFMVDPNFLSYKTTPIEITAVVRRNPADDNAGFKLVYESTYGYKNLGWYTVPDNKAWHTMKWRIDDAQFVSKWGYNFSFDSDGNQYNKYYIQSVTVRKLEN
jgi:hypothetical protein